MALGDDVKRLIENVAMLTARVGSIEKALDEVNGAQSEMTRIVADLRRDYEKEIALLKQDAQNRGVLLKGELEKEIALVNREIEDFKNWKAEQKKLGEERSRRLWAFGPNLVAALLGGLIAAAVAYFIPRR